VFLLCGAAALILGLGRAALRDHLLDLVVTSLALWGGIWAANLVLGSAIAGAVGSLAGIGAGLVLIRWRTGQRLPGAGDVLGRGAPYLVLLASLLVARGVAVLVGGSNPATAVLASPATWLLLTSAVFAPSPRATLLPTVRRWAPVAAATVLFLLVGAVMATSGLAATLATEAGALGPGYPAFAPWLGGLGGFLTGSNVGANGMFVVAQAQVAHHLGLPVLTIVAVQNIGASLTTMASAPRIALALQAAGAEPDGSGVLLTLLTVDAVTLAAISVLATVLCL
jgi:lactate permease